MNHSPPPLFALPLLVVASLAPACANPEPTEAVASSSASVQPIDWVRVYESSDWTTEVWYPEDGSAPVLADGTPHRSDADALRFRILEEGMRETTLFPIAFTAGIAPNGERAVSIHRNRWGTAGIYTRFPGVSISDPARTTGCLGLRIWGNDGAASSIANATRDAYSDGPDDLSDISYLAGFTVRDGHLTVRGSQIDPAFASSVPALRDQWNIVQFEIRDGAALFVRVANGPDPHWIPIYDGPSRIGLVSAGLNKMDLDANEGWVRTIALVRGLCP